MVQFGLGNGNLAAWNKFHMLPYLCIYSEVLYKGSSFTWLYVTSHSFVSGQDLKLHLFYWDFLFSTAFLLSCPFFEENVKIQKCVLIELVLIKKCFWEVSVDVKVKLYELSFPTCFLFHLALKRNVFVKYCHLKLY